MESGSPRNRNIATRSAQLSSENRHVAEEIPPGSPQIEYSVAGDQWVPKGNVLRFLIGDDEEGRLVVEIDDHELCLEEFGGLVTTYAGWGMRIEFVPKDEVARRPSREVRGLKPEEE